MALSQAGSQKEKNKVTLFSSTLKVQENKTPFFLSPMPSYGHIVVLKIIIENISQMRLEGRSSGGLRRSRHLILW